jgi:hypothetical protein
LEVVNGRLNNGKLRTHPPIDGDFHARFPIILPLPPQFSRRYCVGVDVPAA